MIRHIWPLAKSDIGGTRCRTCLIDACWFRRWRHWMSDMSENLTPFFRNWQHQMTDISNRRLQFQTLAAPDVRHVWKSPPLFRHWQHHTSDIFESTLATDAGEANAVHVVLAEWLKLSKHTWKVMLCAGFQIWHIHGCVGVSSEDGVQRSSRWDKCGTC